MSIKEGLKEVIIARKEKLIDKITARKWYNKIKNIKEVK